MTKLIKSLLSTSLTPFFMVCAISNPRPRIISVNEKNANNTIDLVVNDQLEIYLPGNPTTGYEWKLVAIDESILKHQGETEYESKTEAVGTGGCYIFRFMATAIGESRVEITYVRPFDPPDVSSADEYKIFVKVSK
jgi:inhibitor of cysteine peptidase